tara:strand:- start:974 stop:1291 length:318 start_codon:yes stop_codon:yes gene_type:complete
MSYKWPDKDKDEVVDYSVDWSRFIGDDTVAAAVWYIKDSSGVKTLVENAGIVNGLQFVTGTISGKVSTARFSLGTNNTRYTIVCSITTGSGLQYERSIFLRVKEK